MMSMDFVFSVMLHAHVRVLIHEMKMFLYVFMIMFRIISGCMVGLLRDPTTLNRFEP